ncbi:DUF6495 family protein [Croceiramulus getboli]|nr:DUF6495 family protein [Flavobacteriaceae bacterium YJPT1-3]
MKYRRLTQEQLEELHQEFINFLATQSITAEEWKTIKANQPEVAEEELDVFSDLVWEGVLRKAEYLEHISPQSLYLFQVEETQMDLIAVKINNDAIDITSDAGYQWLREHLTGDEVELFTASKSYSDDKPLDVFKLVEQGAVITKGELYQWFETFVDTQES